MNLSGRESRRRCNLGGRERRGRCLKHSRFRSCNSTASASTTNATHFLGKEVVVVVLSAAPRVGLVPRTIVLPRISTSCAIVAVFTLPRFLGARGRDRRNDRWLFSCRCGFRRRQCRFFSCLSGLRGRQGWFCSCLSGLLRWRLRCWLCGGEGVGRGGF